MATEANRVKRIMDQAREELLDLVGELTKERDELRAQKAPEALAARIAELEAQAEDLDDRLHRQTLSASRLSVRIAEQDELIEILRRSAALHVAAEGRVA